MPFRRQRVPLKRRTAPRMSAFAIRQEENANSENGPAMMPTIAATEVGEARKGAGAGTGSDAVKRREAAVLA